jgi:hypothetical protein
MPQFRADHGDWPEILLQVVADGLLFQRLHDRVRRDGAHQQRVTVWRGLRDCGASRRVSHGQRDRLFRIACGKCCAGKRESGGDRQFFVEVAEEARLPRLASTCTIRRREVGNAWLIASMYDCGIAAQPAGSSSFPSRFKVAR